MTKTLAVLLGISFASIALLGFSAAAGPHAGCVTDAFQKLQGNACPVSGGPFTLLASHLGSLQSFAGAMATVFLALLALALAFAFSLAAPPPRSLVYIADMAAPRARAKRLRWTARHEMSPTDAP